MLVQFQKIKKLLWESWKCGWSKKPTNILVQNAEFPGFAKGYKDFFDITKKYR
jgi:hypothetical protein